MYSDFPLIYLFIYRHGLTPITASMLVKTTILSFTLVFLPICNASDDSLYPTSPSGSLKAFQTYFTIGTPNYECKVCLVRRGSIYSGVQYPDRRVKCETKKPKEEVEFVCPARSGCCGVIIRVKVLNNCNYEYKLGGPEIRDERCYISTTKIGL